MSAVTTFLIFTDLPKHIEWRVDGFPVLQEGEIIEFDMNLVNPLNMKRSRKVNGNYVISRKILKYSTTKPIGFTQYLELTPKLNPKK
jgi:hypothetical protein